MCCEKQEPGVELNNGVKMPRLGLGTWKIPVEHTKEAVIAAVEAGYRLIDTANDYGNEHMIGEALADLFGRCVVKREELFVQCKLWNANHRPEHVRPDLEATLRDLQLDYVDSYLIHWPQAAPSTGERAVLRTNGTHPAPHAQGTMFPLDDNGYYMADLESHYLDTWDAMEELVDLGLTKSIGLSNFNRRQIEEILTSGNKYKPSVLQTESHPCLHEKDLRDYCRVNGIVFQAYSALGSMDRPSHAVPKTGYEILTHPDLKVMAEKHNKTVAEVILRWHLQMGGSMIAKSSHPERIRENFQIWDFCLHREDMRVMDALNVGWRILLWPEVAHHPDYPFKDELPHNFRLPKPVEGQSWLEALQSYVI